MLLTPMSSVSSLPLAALQCIVPPMTLGERLLMCRKERGWSQRELGKRLGVTRNAVSLWESDESEPENHRLKKAAVLFDTSYEWLATGRGNREGTLTPIVGLRLIGDIAAGVWREVSESQEMEFKRVPVAPVDDYPLEAQYALRIVGNSVDRVAKDGAIIHCVDVARAGLMPRDGDLVCVERGRAGLQEMTVKRIRMGKEGLELWPESNDPAHQEKLPYKAPRGSGEVVIKAIVIGVFQPIARGS